MDKVFRTKMEAGDTIAYPVFMGSTMVLSMVDPTKGLLECKTINGYTMKQVAEFREAFSKFTTNGCSISTKDFASAVRSLEGCDPTDAEVRYTMDNFRFGGEHGQAIDFDDFMMACRVARTVTEDPERFGIRNDDDDRTENTGEDPTAEEADDKSWLATNET